jgi:hypothetical protein
MIFFRVPDLVEKNAARIGVIDQYREVPAALERSRVLGGLTDENQKLGCARGIYGQRIRVVHGLPGRCNGRRGREK